MNKLLLLFYALILFVGCKKEASHSSQDTNGDNLLLHQMIYTRTDTTAMKTLATASFTATLNVTYSGVSASGLGLYHLQLGLTSSDPNYNYTYANNIRLYKNGSVYEFYGTQNLPVVVQRELPLGTYYYTMTLADGIVLQTIPFTVVNEPIAPSGMLCLYRYFNSTSGQHICTYDWQELGSYSVGFQFEKVLGYTYPSITSAPDLKPIYRYYKSSDGSHFTTDIQGNYVGFVYEKILGYVGTSQTATMNRSLTKYYLSSTDDHFVCVPPDVPTYPGFTKDVDFVFGYVQ